MHDSQILDTDPPEPAPELRFDAAGARMIAWIDVLDAVPKAGVHSAAAICHATIGLAHFVPEPLQHIGCMWLEEGDETRRCGKQAAWTMGTCLRHPRLYCEEHGRTILAHRLRCLKPRRDNPRALAAREN